MVGAMEMLLVRSAPVLPTLAQVESSLDSVADTEGAGVLGEGLATAGNTGAAGGDLFVSERMSRGDCVDDGAPCAAETTVLIAGAKSGKGSLLKTPSKLARLKLGNSVKPLYAGVDSSRVIRLALASLCLN